MLVIFLRVVILYFVIIFSVRLMGKRQLGELQPSELAITILISNIATLPIEEVDTPLFMGLLPILSLVSFEVIISIVNLHYPRVRRVFSGSPVVVIQNGEIDQKKLHILRYSVDDLMSQLRSQNVYDINDVDFALVETTGQLSVYEKYKKRTISPETLNMEDVPKKDAPPLILVTQGKINHEFLDLAKKDDKWLMDTIHSHHLKLSQVYFLSVDNLNKITLIKSEYKKVM